MTFELALGETQISYTLTRSKRQTIGIRVGASGVLVNAPKDISLDTIEKTIQQKAAWVVHRQARLLELNSFLLSPRTFESGETLRYLGRQYRLKRISSQEAPNARMRGAFIEVQAQTSQEAKKALEFWYQKQAKQYLPARLHRLSFRKGMASPPPVLIRSPKRRWGSCNQKGEIRLNWRIIMAPQSLIDYVIVHELCHLEHPNHSTAFWQSMHKLMPDYALRRERLAMVGIQYTLE